MVLAEMSIFKLNIYTMKKLILLFIVLLLVGCSKDDNGTSSNSDPLIGSWAFVNGDGITGDLTNRNNGTYTISYPDDWDSPSNGSWMNISAKIDFNNRVQTYLTNLGRHYDEPWEQTIIFSTDFASFTHFGIEFVKK